MWGEVDMDDIFVNSVIELRDEEMKITTVERVLWIASDRSQIVVISISDNSQLPEYKDYKEVGEALHNE